MRVLSIDSGLQYSVHKNNQVRASGDETRTKLISVRHPPFHLPDAFTRGHGVALFPETVGTALFVDRLCSLYRSLFYDLDTGVDWKLSAVRYGALANSEGPACGVK